MSEVTSKDVAQWMIDRINAGGVTFQEDLVQQLIAEFGSEWTYQTEYGSDAIQRKVLNQFRNLHRGKIQWDNGNKCWEPA